MEYENIVRAYYLTGGTGEENGRKILDRNKNNVELAGFYANNLKEYDDYYTFESMNAWQQITQSKILKGNVVEIVEL